MTKPEEARSMTTLHTDGPPGDDCTAEPVETPDAYAYELSYADMLEPAPELDPTITLGPWLDTLRRVIQ